MSEFIWLDKYKIGNDTIDQQHEYLFDLANRIVDPKNAHTIAQNIMLLFRYVREHFKTEEDIMKQYHYSDYDLHVNQHEQLIEALTEISKGINSGETGLDDIAGFMHNWLLTHILEKDLQIGDFLHTQQTSL